MSTLGNPSVHNTFMKIMNNFNLDPFNESEVSNLFFQRVKSFLDKNLDKSKVKYKTYDELMNDNNVAIDRYLFHLNSGGYAMIFKYGYYICKIIPQKEMNAGYSIPTRIDKEVKSMPMRDFIALPYCCAFKTNIDGFLFELKRQILLVAMAVAYIDKKPSLDAKDILKDTSLKTFFVTNRKYPPIIAKAIQQVSKNKVSLSLFNNFYNLASFYDMLETSKKTLIYFPIAMCSSNKFPSKDYTSQMLLQVLLAYYAIESHYSEKFVHRDLKLDNILVFEDRSPLMLEVKINGKNRKYVIASPYKFKINDFDLSLIKETGDNEWFLDLHFLVHSMIHYCNFEVSDNLKDFFLKPVCGNNCSIDNRWQVTYSGERYKSLEDLGDFIINNFDSFENDF
jgi:hypothetical protein